MLSIDTNVAIRAMVGDHKTQSEAARRIIRDGVWISFTVLQEIEWVLKSNYQSPRDERADAIENLLITSGVATDDTDGALWAIDRLRAGADFADMIHIVASRGKAAFMSFEKRLDRLAGPACPVAVVRPDET